jgi:GNAT superfamily N-acetyltransferase
VGTGMSTNIDEVRALEERLFNAWPAMETLHMDGYLFRFAGGHTKRSNAVSAWKPSAMPVDEVIAEASRAYRAVGLTPLFRISPLADPALDPALDAKGWEFFEPSLVLTRPLGRPFKMEGAQDAAVVLDEAPSPQWVEGAAQAYDLADWQTEFLGQIVSRIRRPTAFATVLVDRQPAAYGLAVYDRGYVGLYDLAVREEFRSRGIGRRMITGLLYWGLTQGATRAYLQMREENVRAHKLYSELGFMLSYRYTHRRKY